ncbi:hypothetical protein CDLVIII_1232 [Clostridium sp. DL-VIII]|uniref:hypothetical protein n=1 Tax=Clostridium sp. DL-VIII TaxID=641107 RepID=UPI00023AF69F|nr:hypothetical protein [Clostridium sp. DL-VIII]EHI97933.1 hypothetical protein CDLVIII_1232 [Clostridium sp. DL-VIII]
MLKINIVKKVLAISLLIFLLIFLVISHLDASISINSISGKPKVYTKDEALNMFDDERKEFDEIAKILLSNESFWQNVKDKETGTVADMYFLDGEEKKYFSKEEWDKINKFFNNTRPYSISRRGDSVIIFDYRTSDKQKNIGIYYFSNAQTDRAYYSQMYLHFDNIDDHWYVGYGISKAFTK